MKKLLLVLAVLSLTACGRTDEEARALLAKPAVSDAIMVDGCEVKFVDRGYQNHSFYLAKCGNTNTLTRNYEEQSGKTRVFRRSTVITQEIEQLQKEKADVETKEQALAKLSAEERKALGIK